jgi:hypothetical protein
VLGFRPEDAFLAIRIQIYYSSLFNAIAKLCADPILAVECVPHSAAETMLKQTSTRVVMEVFSWMGTEL